MICHFVYSLLLLLLAASFALPISGDGEADALLKFKSSLVNANALEAEGWDSGVPPCTGDRGSHSTWKGVMCDNGVVYALRLENMSLSGTLDMQPLVSMPSLESVSFMYNSFEGPMPRGVDGIVTLVYLYLAHNKFSGEIDGDLFDGMNNLVKVHLEGNMFYGEIPESLGRLPKLTELNLEDNMFTGKIPPFKHKSIVTVNVTNNQLEGRIPVALSLMNTTFFQGNKGLCGPPLLPCKNTPPLLPVFLLAITILAVVALVFFLCSIFIFGRRKHKASEVHEHGYSSGLGTLSVPSEQQLNEKSSMDSKVYRKLASEVSQRDSVARSSILELPREEVDKRVDQKKLHFVRNDQEKFTLQEMLCASAEVLGSGGFGSSYKAALPSGRAVVIKRFRFMSNIGREEFYDYMKRIGRLSHPNLLPLIAFHYRKDEKLFVTDYIPLGSLANLLHANRTPGQVVLDWPIRLKIAKGVTRALDYLYKIFPALNLPHGHLKSSNVLLDHDFEPLLTDYALVPVVNKEQSHFMVAYKSPEFTLENRTSRKSDVWSLGILILELLTGKFPANYLRHGKGTDDELAAWVESVARTEWTPDVFDTEMQAGREQEGQMLKLLKIGLRCCDWDVERRMELHEAVDRIEEVDHGDVGESFQESFRSSYVTADYEYRKDMILHDNKPAVVYSLLVLLLAVSFFVPISSDGDADALLKFKSSLVNATVLTGWGDSGDPPCTGKKGSNSKWKGVMCSAGVVYALRLENMSLAGTLDVQALGSMRGLKSVSFMRNGLEGPIPRGLVGLGSLVHLYLAHNRFSGEIDGGFFDGMKDLVKVHLEGNRFSGEIPKSLGKLPKLTELNLEDNLFTGKIPPFNQKNLVTVNVANNRLEGRIPLTLGLMNITFFLGNKGLCGPPLLPCRHPRTPLVAVFLLALTVLAVIVLITVFCSVCILSRRQRKTPDHDRGHIPSLGLGTVYGPSEPQQNSEKSSQDSKVYRKLASEAVQRDSTATSSVLSERALPREEDQRKLHFVRNDQEKFTLQDMLRASAEVLGSGGFGSSYKAALTGSRAVVVKRFRFMNNIRREEFYDHMKKIGRLSHPNLLPLIAFYYRKDEKLLVTNYIPNGSLANLLHANRTPGQVVLDWPIRLKIARGVTRGLAYLYRTFPDLNLPHGHLKSSNVLLDHDLEPLLTDYALVPVVNKEQSHQFMVAYKSPEFTQQDRTSRKSDVWSLGILILEILTGKFPANYLRQGKGADDELAAWVESVARTEWNADVFDKEMRAGKEQEGQMLKLLKIGLRCCDWDVERRMELHEAVDRIEEVDHREAGGSQESFRSSYVTASDGENRFSRAMTGEFSLVSSDTVHLEMAVTADYQVQFPENDDIYSILAAEGIEFLLSHSGEVPLEYIHGKTICLFFSANWCRPCKDFTPELVKLYESLQKRGEEIEIIFVSFDHDMTLFYEHFWSMPWLAVPFSLSLRNKLTDKYRVARIPSLVPLFPGEISVADDVIGLIEDYGPEAFPFTKKRKEELKAIDESKCVGGQLEKLLTHESRSYVVSRNGSKVLVSDLVGKTIGLYFGAHWCPPFRSFTSQLIDVYNELTTSTKGSFEVILVSTDRDSREFNINMTNMPWLAIPYEDRTRQDLCRIFNIKLIPALVIIGPEEKTVCTNAREMVSLYGSRSYPFTESRIVELEACLKKEGDSFPRKVKDKKHEHELKLDMAKAYVCDFCKKQGKFWAFSCDACDYDLHPTCVEGQEE
ncbi:hypothetical protein YC2023_007726 [Brassica napus]